MIRPAHRLSTKLRLKVNSGSNFCALCGRRSRESLLCPACQNDLPRNPSGCRRCAQPLPRAGHLCGQCLRHPLAQQRTLAPFIYRFPVNALVTGFKYQRRKVYGRALAEAWLNEVAIENDERPDLLVPTPLHWRRRLNRGFNQAGELAAHWGKALGIPVDHGLCRRGLATPSQTGLDRAQRRRNLRRAFVITQRPPPHVAVVDDVVTTGSTGDALARALLRAGAERVEIWALARTP
ncbi:ComF family protein [Marinobacteraceae bacterium S3BR75-40.1]